MTTFGGVVAHVILVSSLVQLAFGIFTALSVGFEFGLGGLDLGLGLDNIALGGSVLRVSQP